MASVYATYLQNVKISQGIEDWHVEAEVYLKDTFVGLYLDEGSGGNGILKFECDINTQREFYYVAWRYFASYPEVDTLSLYDLTQKDFNELKNSLPKVCYKEWPDEKVGMFFISRLIYLYQLEKIYEDAYVEGYKAIVVAKFYSLRDIKAEPEKIFYTDGSDDSYNKIIGMLEENSHNYTISKYHSKDDFIVR